MKKFFCRKILVFWKLFFVSEWCQKVHLSQKESWTATLFSNSDSISQNKSCLTKQMQKNVENKWKGNVAKSHSHFYLWECNLTNVKVYFPPCFGSLRRLGWALSPFCKTRNAFRFLFRFLSFPSAKSHRSSVSLFFDCDILGVKSSLSFDVADIYKNRLTANGRLRQSHNWWAH